MRVSWVLATVGGGGRHPGFLCAPGAVEAPAAGSASNSPNPFSSKACASRCRPFSRGSLTMSSPSQLHSVQFRHNDTVTTRKGWRARRTPSSSHPLGSLALSSRADHLEEVEEEEEEEEEGEEDEGAVRAEHLDNNPAASLQRHQGNRSVNDNAEADSSTTPRRVDESTDNLNQIGAAAAAGGAERRFAVARSLHLRRHRSRQARETALRLFRESMLLRPDWRETDTKFAVESGIDEVFAAFAFAREKGFREEDYSSYCDPGVDRGGGAKSETSWDASGRRNRHDDASCDEGSDAVGGVSEAVGDSFGDAAKDAGSDGVKDAVTEAVSDSVDTDVNEAVNDPVSGAVIDAVNEAVSDAVGDAVVGDAVGCLRRTLAGVGYTAFRVQERFGPAVGAMGAQRLPGPYYLRKSLDHTHAATVASLGPPRDSLDVAIRLFLLGLALPRADLERSLGRKAVSSAVRLGMLGECPVDPSLLVSLVQLFPLDAEALSSPSAAAKSSQNHEGSREQASAAAIDPSEPRQREGKQETGREGQAGVGGLGSRSLTGVGGRGSELREGVGASAAACGVDGVAAASDLIFATDWPPPGSTALTEEPVMYIGPDSIGLVQHAPRRIASRPRPADVGRGGAREDGLRDFAGGADVAGGADIVDGADVVDGTDMVGGVDAADGGGAARAAASAAGQAGEGVLETVLDLCCGSGVQGIAAAALRGGNALVTCVDINPRAIRFARFNALLNGLDESRFRAVAGDLYCALGSRRRSDETGSSGAVQERPGGAEKQTRSAEGDNAPRSTLGGTARREASGGGGGGAREVSGEWGPRAYPFEDGEEASSRNSLNAPLGGGAPGAPRIKNASKFDLILVNPPFVPVPPRLDSVRRRYDVFAAGGANGEEIVEGIFRGAMDHLRPGGVLAMVSELVNPRAFDVKLRRWVGARDPPENNAAAEAAAAAEAGGVVAVPVVERGRAEGSTPENEQRDRGGGADSRFPDWGGDASPSSSLTGVGDGDGGTSPWTGVVLHEKAPWTAREYAARRAGTAREAQGWERHLALVGVEEMAPGFVFVRRRGPPSSEARGAGDERGSRRGGGVMGDFDVDIQGVEKLWAPHNKVAVENTAAVLGRM